MNGCSDILLLSNSQQTKRLGYLLGQNLAPGSVILLQGELGAGKTTLIQGLGAGLGITDAIASPTFTLVNEYLEGRIPLYHLDLYRLQPEQARAIYPEVYWEGEEVIPGITAIEWSERLQFKPPSYININLVYNEERGRRATLNFVGECDLNLDFQRSLTQTKVDGV